MVQQTTSRMSNKNHVRVYVMVRKGQAKRLDWEVVQMPRIQESRKDPVYLDQ